MSDHRPRYVYKYLPDRLDRIGDIVVNRRVFFSSPAEFNDPFDCARGIRFPSPQHLTSDDELCWRWYFEHLAEMREEKHTTEENIRDAVHAFEIGKHRDLGFVSECEREIENEIQHCGREMGVFCVSETKESVSMWAHYAANHRGVVIEFDHSSLVDPHGEVRSFKVNYRKSLPTLCEYRKAVESGDPLEFAKLFFCRKSPEWGQEQEWRFFTNQANVCLDLPELSITRIIFGARMPVSTKNLIQKWVQNEIGNITLSDSFPSNESLKMLAKDRTPDL